jgi:hypothetical protein
VHHSIKQVRAGDALRRAVDEIAVIGGAHIFRDTLDIADWLLITRVQLEPEGDTRFPCLDQSVWEEISRTEHPKGKDDDAGVHGVPVCAQEVIKHALPRWRPLRAAPETPTKSAQVARLPSVLIPPRRTAGASGFFDLIQSGERPER